MDLDADERIIVSGIGRKQKQTDTYFHVSTNSRLLSTNFPEFIYFVHFLTNHK